MNVEGAAFIERGIVLEVCENGYKMQKRTRALFSPFMMQTIRLLQGLKSSVKG